MHTFSVEEHLRKFYWHLPETCTPMKLPLRQLLEHLTVPTQHTGWPVCRRQAGKGNLPAGRTTHRSNGCMFSRRDPETEGSLALIIILKYYPQLWCQPGVQAFPIVCTALSSESEPPSRKAAQQGSTEDHSWPKTLTLSFLWSQWETLFLISELDK